jgi:hypothetical protein
LTTAINESFLRTDVTAPCLGMRYFIPSQRLGAGVTFYKPYYDPTTTAIL